MTQWKQSLVRRGILLLGRSRVCLKSRKPGGGRVSRRRDRERERRGGKRRRTQVGVKRRKIRLNPREGGGVEYLKIGDL